MEFLPSLTLRVPQGRPVDRSLWSRLVVGAVRSQQHPEPRAGSSHGSWRAPVVDPANPRVYSGSMPLRSWLAFAVLLSLTAATAWSQQATAPTIVQPGAPGQNSKILAASAVHVPAPEPSEADTKFMQGMIHHHAQAVEMTALMPTHTHNKALLAFGKRISISQTDEIKSMKQWLADRGKAG